MELEQKDWARLKAASEAALKELEMQRVLHDIALTLSNQKLKKWEAEKTTTETAQQKNTE